MTEVWISLSTVRLTVYRVRVSSGDAPYITFITGAHVGAGGGG